MKKYQLSRIYSVLKDRSRSGFPTGSFFVESARELFLISEYRVLDFSQGFISPSIFDGILALKAKIDSPQIMKTKGIVKCPQSRKLTTKAV